jgi:hypothetical protein
MCIIGEGTTITGSIQISLGFQRGKITKNVNDMINDSTDCTIVRSVITGKSEATGQFKNIATDHEGNLNVNINQPRDVFGHMITAEPKVMWELKFPYVTSHMMSNYYNRGSSM